MKILSLFNHKGGVSKTTTTFNLGWMLAEQGHKTLIVDADPQCNLTALVLDYNAIEDIEDYYAQNPGCDIATGVEPVFTGAPAKLSPGNPSPTPNDNLYLYCGNLLLSEMETQISVSLTTSAALPAMQNIPGSLGSLLRETANAQGFDYVLIDMSPSVGALNECLLMSSDYFIVPTSPDFFCAQAVRSLSQVIPRWNKEVQPFRRQELVYPLSGNPPRFLGFISQRYRPRSGAPAKSFQRWIDIIRDTVSKNLIPALKPIEMAISLERFRAHVKSVEGDEPLKPYNLANVADFNSLIAQSQKHNVPVFALSDDQIEQAGVILETMVGSRDRFRETFSTLAENLHGLMSEV